MTKEWVDKEIEKTEKVIEELKEKAVNMPCSLLVRFYMKTDEWNIASIVAANDVKFKEIRTIIGDNKYKQGDMNTGYLTGDDYEKISDILNNICDGISYINELGCWYVDETKEFDGDIIITDPCYLIPTEYKDDEKIYDRLSDMINEYGIQKSTLEGDIAGNIYDNQTKNKIGSFCSDSGMICVVPLDKVVGMFTEFKVGENNMDCMTLIKDYHGDVSINVDVTEYGPYVWIKGENFTSKKED